LLINNGEDYANISETVTGINSLHSSFHIKFVALVVA